ncbi:hypothetical protein [Roseivivax marinus]|uniref:hypothetical protein n=1 Tax=Roseivivax marinus TaxID=1379903 RepID=UPI003B96AD30
MTSTCRSASVSPRRITALSISRAALSIAMTRIAPSAGVAAVSAASGAAVSGSEAVASSAVSVGAGRRPASISVTRSRSITTA